MIEIVTSTRDRTCQTCGETIPAKEYHIEARGGPKVSYWGHPNNWVQFHHIACVQRLMHDATSNDIQARRRRARLAREKQRI